MFRVLVIAVASKLFLKGSSYKVPEARSKDKQSKEKVSLKTAFKLAFKKELRLF